MKFSKETVWVKLIGILNKINVIFTFIFYYIEIDNEDLFVVMLKKVRFSKACLCIFAKNYKNEKARFCHK